MKNKYNFDKKTKCLESAKQTMNGIVDICLKKDYRVLSITTSTVIIGDKQNFCSIFLKVLEERKIKAKCINMEEGKEFDIPSKENDEFILLNLPPVLFSANALECMKKCDGCILIERYTQTAYSQFQSIVTLLKDNNVNPIGIVAYR